ncbi:tetratricopeptide repeat protein [Patescibacteria group bacterium]|nr:MAG: tetratricopeptide repeat protein [Patescibacteria group bacterium]
MEKMNPKHSKAVIALVVFTTIVALIFLYREKLGSTVRNLNQTGSKQATDAIPTLPYLKCDFQDDAEAYQAAMEKVNPEACACIKDGQQQDECQSGSLELVKFQQIIRQYNLSRCQELQDTQRQKLCEQAITDGIAKITAEDPLYLAGVYINNNNFSGAVSVLNAAIKADSRSVEALLALALTYANQGLAEHRETELVPRALALVDQAIAIDPNSSEAYRVQGFVYEVKPDYEAALGSYSRSLEIDSSYVLSYVGRGHTYNMMSQIGNAMNDLQKAKELDVDKKYSQIYGQLCRLESEGGQIKEAIDDCTKNIELANGGQKAEAYGMMANLYLQAGQADQAADQIQMALAIAPQNPSINLTAANVYIGLGDLGMAKDYANKAIKLDSQKAMAYLQLAKILLQQNDANGAVTNGEKALSLIDSDVSILLPNKAGAKQSCYDLLANAYGQKEDKANETKYREMNLTPSEE